MQHVEINVDRKKKKKLKTVLQPTNWFFYADKPPEIITNI